MRRRETVPGPKVCPACGGEFAPRKYQRRCDACADAALDRSAGVQVRVRRDGGSKAKGIRISSATLAAAGLDDVLCFETAVVDGVMVVRERGPELTA